MQAGSFTIKDNSGLEADYEMMKFSGGEIQVRLSEDLINLGTENELIIYAHLTDSDKIMELAMLMEAFEDNKLSSPSLVCPYVPYARQDRKMERGESIAIKEMARFINHLGFLSVEIWDPHSDVTVALIRRVEVVSQEVLVQRVPLDMRNIVLVSPDAGAMKKIGKVAKLTGCPVVEASKKRDTSTGEITGTVVHSDHVGDKDFLICDDICDGGRTFTELAKELRPLTNGKIYLYVTHGIFSKKLDVFKGLIDHVYCAMVFPNVEKSDLLTELNFNYDPTHN
ncbi:MAG: ribose-phosphate diphosphokinase [Janthinobacterium lividum]